MRMRTHTLSHSLAHTHIAPIHKHTHAHTLTGHTPVSLPAPGRAGLQRTEAVPSPPSPRIKYHLQILCTPLRAWTSPGFYSCSRAAPAPKRSHRPLSILREVLQLVHHRCSPAATISCRPKKCLFCGLAWVAYGILVSVSCFPVQASTPHMA